VTSTGPEKLIWDEWRRITRFIESSRIAFSREELIWSSLEVSNKKEITLSTKLGGKVYAIALEQHLLGIQDHQVLFSTVLLASYALVESFARLKLGLSDNDQLAGGIEAWGAQILAATGHGWSNVMDGLSGIVEVSVLRNAFAHGVKNANQSMVNRFLGQSLTPPWAVGDKMVLTYEKIDRLRSRLKSLMRFSGNLKRSIAPPAARTIRVRPSRSSAP
jgi:hypothetical protein